MMLGAFLHGVGACPVCGTAVTRVREMSSSETFTLVERYACGLCGEVAYAAVRSAA